MQCHPSRQWGHGNTTSHWWLGIPEKWILSPKENTIWITSIPPSLVQHNQRDFTQDGPQYLTTRPLPPFRCTYKPLLSWHHLRISIPNPRRPLCWKCHGLLLRSNPGGPIQNITPMTHPSRFHGRYWLFIRYYIYLDQTQRREHILPSMPIIIHWIHS